MRTNRRTRNVFPISRIDYRGDEGNELFAMKALGYTTEEAVAQAVSYLVSRERKQPNRMEKFAKKIVEQGLREMGTDPATVPELSGIEN